MVEETLLILQESQYYSLLELVDAILENKFSFFFGKYHLFRIVSFRVDFRCVHRLQFLAVCDQYVTLPNSPRAQCVSEEQSE